MNCGGNQQGIRIGNVPHGNALKILYEKNKAALSEELSKVESKTPGIEGMQSSIQQHELEQLRKFRSNSKDYDKGLENE